MYKVGISSLGKRVDEALFKEFAENGISDIELSENNYDNFNFKDTFVYAKEYNVRLWSLHLPFVQEFEMSSLDKAVREHTISKFSETVKNGADIGISKFIIHPSSEPIDDAEREDRKKYSRESLSLLADVCESCGSILCVEDLPRTCLGHSIEEMKFLTAEDERLKICFDTNHITVEKPEDVLEALGDKIVTLHVSDFDFVNERHWLPGEGNIDWQKIMQGLKNIGYNGSFMYELYYKCPKTILRDRDLNAADFRKNADELFSGKQLTTFSTHKPNLGMWE